MQLDFTAEQEELRSSVRQVLDKECPPSVVRDLVEQGTRPEALWTQVVALDWPALTVPEAAGGIGLGPVELAVLAEEVGRAMAPGPLLATIAQMIPVVTEAGTDEQQQRYLGPVAAGDRTGTLAVAEDGDSWDVHDIATELRPAGDGFELSGTKRWVVEAGHVHDVVIAVRLPNTTGVDGVSLVVVPTTDLAGRIESVTSFDASRSVAHLALDGVFVTTEQVLGAEPGQAATSLTRALEQATVAVALEMVGTCQAIFDLTLAYAREREQFGVPIGSFQAIKHKLADCLVELERARATAYFASAAIAEDDARRSIAASMAKAAAGDCQQKLAKEGIQIHGGIGYMWENDLQLLVKRAKSGELLFGGAAHHRARVADLIGV